MPINLQGSGNIAEGWGPPPQLHAPNISGVLGEILQQRRYQEALTQKNIAGAIKQMQEQRQNQAYLEAMQKAGILPEGDYGALGAEGASDLAKQILAKKVADARAEHLTKMEARLSAGGGGRGRGGGGGSGSGSDQAYPETIWDDQGREWRKGPGGRLIPMKPAGGTKADGTKEPNIAQAVKEELGLQESVAEHKRRIAKEEAANIKLGADTKDPKYQNVPYSESEGYHTALSRLEQLKKIPGMPLTTPPSATPAPGASPTPPPADTAAGHADNYGVRPSAAILARAQQALDDPEATEEEKAQARKILGQ